MLFREELRSLLRYASDLSCSPLLIHESGSLHTCSGKHLVCSALCNIQKQVWKHVVSCQVLPAGWRSCSSAAQPL